MKIKNVESIPNILKFKNKEEFTNRIIQEIITICKENSIFFDLSKNIKLITYKESLNQKNKKLNFLLERSNEMKIKVTNKTKILVETNNNLTKKLLQFI